ncbi:tripartite tricarboxylate transporter permease [Hominifimenecus sp. rT4P-3]|uniref:tripartite tricarboxylate transporter permease n=1 Tax=Hominifimenecus sp. rT4P-3 TaxID=3242979 RepID=UPI003DA68BEF
MNLSELLVVFLQPELLLYLTGGIIFGLYGGAIPGISVAMAASLAVSMTFTWDAMPAIAVIIGVHIGGVYGGSRSAILLNVPGTPASLATTFDGYPMAKKGEAAHALVTTAVESVVGGVLGALALLIAAPLLVKLALLFAPRDYFMISLMGILLLGSLSGGSFPKAVFAGIFGMFLGCIGMDGMTAVKRFTYGSINLMSGIDMIAVCIGMFGLSECLFQIGDPGSVEAKKQKIGKIRINVKEVVEHFPLALRSSLIGIAIGALPGTGGNIASIVAYSQAKKNVKNPKVPFGEGAIEGLVAPESSNNAAVGASYIPMLSLGIPGDTTAGLLIAALYMHGITPGPTLFDNSSDIYHLIIACILIGNIILLPVSLSGLRFFAKIAEIPKHVMLPIIIMLCVVGAYATNGSMWDVYVMLVMGVIGYFMRIHDFPTGSVVLGLILGSLIELNFRRHVQSTYGELGTFFQGIVTNPLSCVIFIVLILIFVGQVPAVKQWKAKRKERKNS